MVTFNFSSLMICFAVLITFKFCKMHITRSQDLLNVLWCHLMWLTMYQCRDCGLINVIAGGRGCCGLVYLGTQTLLFHQHLQYSVITDINIVTTVTGVTIVEINLTPLEDQKSLLLTESLLRYCSCEYG